MTDKKNGGSSSLQDLKVELQSKVSNEEASTLRGGFAHTELDNFSYNGCGGMMPQ